MKKVFKNSIMLSALLLMAMALNASIINGGGTSSQSANLSSVSSCEDKSPKMKKLNCIAKDGGPAYGCSNLGTLEVCTVAQTCP